MDAAGGELSDEAFDMLRLAVRMARDHQVRSLEQLRSKLISLHTGSGAVIDQALVAWANHEAAATADR